MGDPSHFNWGPVPRVAGDRYDFKEWLGYSVVPSVVNFTSMLISDARTLRNSINGLNFPVVSFVYGLQCGYRQ